MPPRRCSPKGSSEAAFCGVLQSRRGDASRWARLRRLPTGFSNGGAARSAAVPFCPSLPRRPAVLLSLPSRPANDAARAHSRSREPAGSPFPFPHFPTARPYFFLYPAVLPTMPRATFPASFCPAGRQGQRRFLCRLHGRRSSALPFRPIGGAPGTAPLFLHPAARHRMPRTVAPSIQTAKTTPLPFPCFRATGAPMRTGGQSLLFPLFSARIPRFRAAATHGSFPLLLRAAAPVRGCSRRISPSISAPLCLPRSPLLCARPFRAGFFGSALPCSPPPRAVSGPVPARADASRRSFAFSHARRAPFLPCAPCAPGLCASRRGGESCKAICCALLHARPCSCAGGRIAPFFRLFPRTPRAFLALRPLYARPVRIASRRGKL